MLLGLGDDELLRMVDDHTALEQWVRARAGGCEQPPRMGLGEGIRGLTPEQPRARSTQHALAHNTLHVHVHARPHTPARTHARTYFAREQVSEAVRLLDESAPAPPEAALYTSTNGGGKSGANSASSSRRQSQEQQLPQQQKQQQQQRLRQQKGASARPVADRLAQGVVHGAQLVT